MRAAFVACGCVQVRPKCASRISAEPASESLDFQGKDGAQGRNRTSDTRIFSPLLYQLSYLGAGAGESSLLPPPRSSRFIGDSFRPVQIVARGCRRQTRCPGQGAWTTADAGAFARLTHLPDCTARHRRGRVGMWPKPLCPPCRLARLRPPLPLGEEASQPPRAGPRPPQNGGAPPPDRRNDNAGITV